MLATVAISVLLGYYRDEVARSHHGSFTTMKTVYEVTHGKSKTRQTVLVKWPNKILYSTEESAGKYTAFDAFDGKTSWHGSSDGETVVDDARKAQIVSEIAIATNAPVVAGGVAAEAFSVGTARAFKHTYDVLRVLPFSGEPFELLFDDHSHRLAITQTGRLLIVCSDVIEDPGATCENQKIVDRRNGSSYPARVVSTEYGVPLEDWQFSPRLPQDDASTNALLESYRRAQGKSVDLTSFTMRGHGTYSDGKTFSWSASNSQTDFERAVVSDADRKFETVVVHGDSAVQTTYGGHRIRNSGYAFAEHLAMLHCEFRAQACGVRVSRIGNVWIDGRQLYMLQVTSTRDPAIEYLVGLDTVTYEPRFLKVADERVHLDDIRRSANGAVYAAKQRVDVPGGELTLYVDAAEFRP